MASDEELVDLLDEVWASMSQLGGELEEADWKRPTDLPGWTVQDNLVHVTGIEASLLGRPAPDHELPADLPHVRNDLGRANEVFVDSRRSWSGPAALEEFREVTRERVARLRGMGPDDFGAESWTPVGLGTVRDLLPFRIFDSWVHEQDMRRAVGRPGHLEGPVAEAALERMLSTMPFVVGKRAGAPDGAVVVFDLSGPAARSAAIGVDGGRARRLEGEAGPATVRLALGTETFARLACGRMDPAAALAAGDVVVSGDEALGRRVVEHLNFLF